MGGRNLGRDGDAIGHHGVVISGLVPFMQPGANLVRCERLPAPLGTGDDHTGGGDSRQTCQAEKFPASDHEGSHL